MNFFGGESRSRFMSKFYSEYLDCLHVGSTIVLVSVTHQRGFCILGFLQFSRETTDVCLITHLRCATSWREWRLQGLRFTSHPHRSPRERERRSSGPWRSAFVAAQLNPSPWSTLPPLWSPLLRSTPLPDSPWVVRRSDNWASPRMWLPRANNTTLVLPLKWKVREPPLGFWLVFFVAGFKWFLS